MVRPTDNGSSTCAPTNVATHARRPPLTVIEIPPDAMTTTVTAIITEATHTSVREITHATTDKVTTSTARLPMPVLTRPLPLGQDARNAGNTPQFFTVYQPNNATPPAPPWPLEPLAYATALHTVQAITQMRTSRELVAHVAADRPMAVRPPSQFRL